MVTAHRLVRETLVLHGAAAVYFGVRVLVEGSREQALENAGRLLSFERALGLDVERSIQQGVGDIEVVRALGNFAYVWLHWPLLILILAVVVIKDDPLYRRLRNALFVSGAVGLLIFAVFPVAPPRFLPGYLDTVDLSARTHYIEIPTSWRNRHAAFPSFHVGWTAIACLAAASLTSRRAVKALILSPAVLVAASVVITGNHYMVDAVAGFVIAVTAFYFFGSRTGSGSGASSARRAGGESSRTSLAQAVARCIGSVSISWSAGRTSAAKRRMLASASARGIDP